VTPKERPILFSGAMVRAILAGTKTQTRRALKVQPLDVLPMKGDKAGIEWVGHMQQDPPRGTVFACRHGTPGDRLWVRETWGACSHFDGTAPRDIPRFAAIKYFSDGTIVGATAGYGLMQKARPSIHMPRWASRITLEITAVRVERLQDISEQDALAEGITYLDLPSNALDPRKARTWYRGLWEQINGPGSWGLNPWVWVIEFKRAAP
jgi:hypothetical protein